MTDYVTMAEVLAMHADQIERYGGSQGVRDHGLLEAALFRPRSKGTLRSINSRLLSAIHLDQVLVSKDRRPARTLQSIPSRAWVVYEESGWPDPAAELRFAMLQAVVRLAVWHGRLRGAGTSEGIWANTSSRKRSNARPATRRYRTRVLALVHAPIGS
jgi:hypothetical protein